MKMIVQPIKKLKGLFRGIPKIPAAILLLLFLVAIFANYIAPHNPEFGDPRERLLPTVFETGGSMKFPFGTDTMGRDVFSRVVFGARVSLLVAFAAVFMAVLIGTALGVCAGFFGGWVDQLIMRITDAWLSIPTIMFATLLAVVLGPSVTNIVIIMGLIYWTRYARVTRGEALSLKSRDFVHLATIAGSSKLRIICKHILPNVMNSVITLASLQIGIVIVVEASLTFLGVGVPPPKPAWGLMLSEGRAGLFTGQWWLIVFPGLAIAMLVMSFNLVGDWLRRRLDPHQQSLL